MAMFAEIAVPTPLSTTLHYAVPEAVAARIVVGMQVDVTVGSRRMVGLVMGLSATRPAELGERTPVALRGIFEDRPCVGEDLVELGRWMASYYEAPPGEVLRVFLPVGAVAESPEVITLTDSGQAMLARSALPAAQRELLELLAAGPVNSVTLSARHRRGLKRAAQQGWVRAERIAPKARTQTRRDTMLSLAGPPKPARLGSKRAEVLALLAQGELALSSLRGMVKQVAPVVRQLIAEGVVAAREVEVTASALVPEGALRSEPLNLTDEQALAVAQITSQPGFGAFLLHGVTGSGKTEVYLQCIAAMRAAGRSAIVLVPEISLTPQLAGRFRARFGDAVAVLHSGLSERDRHDEWQRLQQGVATIAVGARSAVFAPVANLGMVIVDEEHDGSFKQEEGVRYHARDVALMRAKRSDAVCVLGSATPAMETYWNCERGLYTRLALTHRPQRQPLPEVEIIDLRRHRPDGDSMLSARLREAVAATLAQGDQVILFLNRRGFATFVLCEACGHTFGCPHCSVSLTYHQARDQMACHYCGYVLRPPDACPSCKAHGTIARKGIGTERIAEAVAQVFPTAKVARLDRDIGSVRKLEALLASVNAGDVDILVGTQMVTKGHDFAGVTLVGVLCADTGLSLPDFRATERTFQLLSQVAGRAGRAQKPGRVMVQTYRPDALAVICAQHHDYRRFYDGELEARAELGYPPHGYLAAIRIDGPDSATVIETAQALATAARLAAAAIGDVEIIGPAPAPLERLRNRVRWQIWLRAALRPNLRRLIRSVRWTAVVSSVSVRVDIDPISTL